MGLLTYDTLLMRQVASVLANDFSILGPDGQPVGQVKTVGHLLKRLVMGNRELDVCELDGALVLKVVDRVTMGRDRMSIVGPDGSEIAELVQEITLFKPKVSIHMASGESLVLRGNLWERDFTVAGEAGGLATASRHFGSVMDMFIERDLYALSFTPGAAPEYRAAIIGALIGFDLMRAKQQPGFPWSS
ncbi:LURP-one-related/scramblase family protein [Cutibacterium sp.]|uniref:LURP-one-related/scramblase family protein n=1 Tax=Cutibacterium sp. TaxID=1912221 RepID=UPI0026DBE3C2|nr:phospholipid scramblase-related protein [Cutibacterium sp.]MDO4412176.1 phospholipid scramblase-related protein [Cutibacterium sp.]